MAREGCIEALRSGEEERRGEVDVLRARILELERIGAEGVSVGVQATGVGAEEEERRRRVEEVEGMLEAVCRENDQLKEELEQMKVNCKETEVKRTTGESVSQLIEASDVCDFRPQVISKNDDDLRREYESQIQNVRELRGMYEDRMKTAEEQNRKLREVITEKNRRLELSQRRCSDLRAHAEELETLLGEQESVAKGLQARLSASVEEGRGLAAQLAMVNRLFGRLGDTAELDFERLRLLQNSSENGQVGKEVAGDGSRGDQEGAEGNKKKAEDLKEIAASLPKVWRLLVELLGEEQKEEGEEEEEAKKSGTDGCFDSIPTPYGPKLVISVSRTFIRLKDLILEKKSLQNELGRIRDLNGRLESKLNQQERRLATVKVELKRTWSVVAKMRAQHKQLHTSEQVLRYELQQKRKLLGELKKELQYCREKWDLARLKNSQSEKEWQLLRQEFRARKSVNGDARHDSTEMNSPESGFSDGRGEDEEEDFGDGDVGGNPVRITGEEAGGGVVMPNAEIQDASSDPHQGIEGQDIATLAESTATGMGEEWVQRVNLDILAGGLEDETALAPPNETLVMNGEDEVDSCSTNPRLVASPPFDMSSSSSGSTLDSGLANAPHPAASPARGASERSMEERLRARAERLRRLEEQCSQLFKKVTRTTTRSAELSSRLEELHEQYGDQGSGGGEEGRWGSPVRADTETGEAVLEGNCSTAPRKPMPPSIEMLPPPPPPLPHSLPAIRLPSLIECHPPLRPGASAPSADLALSEEAHAVLISGDNVNVFESPDCERDSTETIPSANPPVVGEEESPVLSSSEVTELEACSQPQELVNSREMPEFGERQGPSSIQEVKEETLVSIASLTPNNTATEPRALPAASLESAETVMSSVFSLPQQHLSHEEHSTGLGEETDDIPIAVGASGAMPMQGNVISETIFGGIIEEEEEDGLIELGMENDLDEEDDMNLDALEASIGGEDDSAEEAMEDEREEMDEDAYIARMSSTIYGLHHGPLFDDGGGTSEDEEGEVMPDDENGHEDEDDDDMDEDGLSDGNAIASGSIGVASLLLQQLPKRMDILRRERHSLEQRLEEGEAALSRALARNAVAERRSRALERGLAQAQERLRVLELEAAVERNKRLLEIKTSLDAVSGDQVAPTTSESRQQSAMHSTPGSLTEEIDHLQRQTLAQIAEFKAAALVSREQREQLCTLTEEVERQEKLVNALEGELASLRMERREQAKALEDASERLKDALELLSHREEEGQSMQNQLDKLREELESSTRENAIVSSKLVDAEERVSRLTAEIEQLKDDSMRLQEVVIKLTGEKEDLFRANHRLEEMRRLVLEDSKWVNDCEIETCTACGVSFSLMIRRHHCRSCGKIFCGACSSHWLTLNSGPGSQGSSLVAGMVESLIGSGKRSRACAECFAAYAREAAEADSRSSKASISYGDGICDSKPGPSKSNDGCGSSNSEGLTDPVFPTGAVEEGVDGKDEVDEEDDAEDFSMISEEEVFLSQCTPYVPNPVTLQYWKSCEIQSGVTSSGSDLLALSIPESGTGGKGKTEEVWVRAGAIYSVPLLIEEKNIDILWEFSTNPNSIAFSVLYKTSMDVPMSSALIVVPTTRVNSHLTPIRGRLRPKRSGVYVLMFDNSFSRFTGKTISYCLRAEMLSKGGQSGRESATSSSRSSVEPFPDLPAHGEEASGDGTDEGGHGNVEGGRDGTGEDAHDDGKVQVLEDEG
ncbi:uncharacterized protein [Hetaerina americana]|uniref:uncharacterized protein n=1 Tax=Hetaerina americana TaxID=62018 RepID=UPI003A7F10C9